jgi:subtilisin family serine protease
MMHRGVRGRVILAASATMILLGAVIWAAGAGSSTGERGREMGRHPEADSPDSTLPEMVVSEREDWNSQSATGQAPSPASDLISVLVHIDPRSDELQRPGIKSFAASRGAFTMYEYEVLPHVINLRRFPRAALEALRSLPGVVEVEEDFEVTMHHNDSMPLIRAYRSQLQAAGYSVDGSGVRVCVIDTGIDSNSLMYSTRIDAAAGWDFVNNDSNPEDDNGHGSHVSGTVLAGFVVSDFPCPTIPAESFQGVAPAATLIGVKALSASGSGSASNIIAAINRCASPALPGGQADVINMSLGAGQFTSTCDADSLAAAANNAVAAGVVVVASAGNSNFSNALGSPACGSNVIAVGAIYDDNFPNCDFPSQSSFTFCTNGTCTTTCTDNAPLVNQRVCFSNRSPMLDVVAPGCIIYSDDSTVAAGNGLIGFCGTSQAAPHVAGLAALLLDHTPSLTPAQAKTLIQNGAVDLGAAGFDSSFGFGRIDAINSLTLAGPPGCTTDPQCSDGQFCNGVERCVSGACQPGTPLTCDDSVSCTFDSCNEVADRCDHNPNHTTCNDGTFCNGIEFCHPTSGCQPGPPPACDDLILCTTDTCNASTDSCQHAPSDAACDDGAFCNGVEFCDSVGGCQPGAPPDCNDGVGCTVDTCDEAIDDCVRTTDEAICNDGLLCNGMEVCNPTSGCEAGSPPTCDDGIACTADTCNATQNACEHAPVASACDDGSFCNGVETCDELLGCLGGVGPNCDDGDECTGDACNESNHDCDHVPLPDTDSDGDCDLVDNCPLTANPGGGVARFAQPLVAHDTLAFSWTSPANVVWVRGDLGVLATYAVIQTQNAAAVTSIPSGPVPAPNNGFYYLVKANCPSTTWSSGGAGECNPASTCPPGGRDGNLP